MTENKSTNLYINKIRFWLFCIRYRIIGQRGLIYKLKNSSCEGETVCPTLRKIYKLSKSDEQKNLIEKAFIMVNKMDKKLREYNYNWMKDNGK